MRSTSAVRAFIAQRLVRLLCLECREVEEHPLEKLEALGFKGTLEKPIYRAKEGGCEACRLTGYRGRMSIYELVRLTAAMGELVTSGAGQAALMVQPAKDGYRPMREYGVRKILAGNTTVEEVVSVTVADG